MPIIIGSYLSPYVRKVLVALHLKGVEYEIDPIVPFFGDDRFARVSPLRRVPVLMDDQVSISDSSVICQYLEERYPEPSLLPAGLAARARARWLEEYADTRMGDVFIWRLFNQAAIKPAVWGESADSAAMTRTLEEDVPGVLHYLEGELPPAGYACGDRLTLADVALASFLRNAELVRFRVDARQWPKVAALAERVLSTEPFARLRPFEDLLMRTPVREHRRVLREQGAPVSDETFGTAAPRRGVMPI